jgi:hypothetical protein
MSFVVVVAEEELVAVGSTVTGVGSAGLHAS